MLRYLSPLLLCLGLISFSGCKTRINFPIGASNISPYRINEGVIISLPDSLKKRTQRVRVSKAWWDSMIFIIPVEDAYKTESRARLSGFFSQRTVLTTHSALSDLETLPAEFGAPTEADTEAELDRILREMEELETGKRKPDQKKLAQLNEQALREASREGVAVDDARYLLRYNRPLFGMIDGRLRVDYRVQLIDRRNGVVLMDKRYFGTSRAFDPRESNRTNELLLISLTKEAFSGAMSRMTEDIALAIDAERMPPL